FNIDPNLFSLFNEGSAGIRREMERQKQLGATWSDGMAKNADAASKSFSDLEGAIGGVANRLGNDLATRISGYAESTANWIGANQGVADSYARIGTESLAAAAGISAVSKLLGFGFLRWIPKAAPLALLGFTGFAGGEDPAFSHQADKEFRRNRGASWLGQNWPRWLGGQGAPSAAAAPITVPKMPSAAYGVMQQTHDFWKSKGFTEPQVAGILAGGPAAESNFNPDLAGDKGTSYGLYQEHNDRMRAMMAKYGPRPTVDQQNQFAWDELSEPQNRNLLRSLHTADGSDQSARLWTSGFERPRGGEAEADRRAAGSGQFVQADGAPSTVNVQLDVHDKRIVAVTTTSGPGVTAPPARVERPMG
ncbi:MAG TPA: phage tail tip lysozyme, partial [Rhizomicrobium sp.]